MYGILFALQYIGLYNQQLFSSSVEYTRNSIVSHILPANYVDWLYSYFSFDQVFILFLIVVWLWQMYDLIISITKVNRNNERPII